VADPYAGATTAATSSPALHATASTGIADAQPLRATRRRGLLP
jgi:hypothetical protein